MLETWIRKAGKTGRITLTRPAALNALTQTMCAEIEAALDAWREDDEVTAVIFDADGDKAFCAGGDVAEVWRTGMAGDFDFGRRFFAEEYRMNAKIKMFPKPTVAFMQGYILGGGVGIGGHCQHRVVCETSQVGMPETTIGLVPDVGGTMILAQAPGRLGEYLGATSARIGAADAIYAGFADHFILREFWLDLMQIIEETGDVSRIAALTDPTPEATLPALQGEIDTLFSGTPAEIEAALAASDSDFATNTKATLARLSPLSIATTIANVRAARGLSDIREVLALEYRATSRAAEHMDFLEGVRAQLIDKDRSPKWKHGAVAEVTEEEVTRLTAPLGQDELVL